MEIISRPRVPRGWTAEWDNNYQEWFYVNINTGRSQWNKPVLAAELPTRVGTYASTRTNPPRNVPEGWKAVWDSKYEEWFYANTHTAETQWEKPIQPAFAPQNKLPSRSRSSTVPLKHTTSDLPSQSSCKQLTPRATVKLDNTEVGKPGSVAKRAIPSQNPVTRTEGHRTLQHKLVDDLQKPHEEQGHDASASTESETEEDSMQALRAMMEKRSRRLKELAKILGVENSLRKEPYQELDDGDSFRILELHPGSRHEPLSGTLLQPLQLNADDPALIQIGDISVPIGPNLHAALAQFRQEHVPRWIWVDQICIDQSHEAEKIQQLKIMAKIYSKARTVLIWLGKASEQSDIAMEFFPIFVEQIRRNDEVATSENSTQTPSNIIESGGALALALNHLFERSWFGRVWTLQEAALASRSEIWCGPKSMDFQVMETFAKGCDNDIHNHWLTALELIGPELGSPDPENPPRPHDAHIHLINKLRGGKSGSASILNSVRHFDCSRDEDRIYSVLRFLDAGLVDEINSEDKPSVAVLYRRAAMYGIRCGELDYLGAAGLSQHCMSYPARHRSSKEPFLSLPSWVSDWTYKIRTHGYWVHNRDHEVRNGAPLFFAGGPAGPAHEWHFSEDGRILSATGIIIDEVKDCAPPFHVLQVPESLADGTAEDKSSTIRTAQTEYQSYITSCMNLATMCISKYGSTKVERACRQSLVGGMMPEGSTTTRGVIKRATDEAIESLFEDFNTAIWIFNEINSLGALMKVKPFKLTGDIEARYARLESAKERLGDFSKGNNLMRAMADACKGRRFFITSSHHYMGVAPDLTEPGDKICVLNGCCAPFVIRPKGTAYQLIGECFVAGAMDGEIMESKGHLSKTILLE